MGRNFLIEWIVKSCNRVSEESVQFVIKVCRIGEMKHLLGNRYSCLFGQGDELGGL